MSFPGLGRVQGVHATRADLLSKNCWFTSACTKKINLRIVFFGIVKTPATSHWAFDSENNDMTAVTKKTEDARELKVHTAGEGDSLVHLTFCQKTAGELACERAK